MINRGDFPTQPASATQRARQWTAHHLYLERVWSAEQQRTGNQNDFGRFVIAHETLALDDEQLRGFALGVNLIPQQALFRAVVNSPTNSPAGVYGYGRSTPIPSGDRLYLNCVTIIAQAADGAYPESDRAIAAFERAVLAHDLYGTYQANKKSPAALAAMIGVLPNLYV